MTTTPRTPPECHLRPPPPIKEKETALAERAAEFRRWRADFRERELAFRRSKENVNASKATQVQQSFKTMKTLSVSSWRNLADWLVRHSAIRIHFRSFALQMLYLSNVSASPADNVTICVRSTKHGRKLHL
jgi:hypothetical protein